MLIVAAASIVGIAVVVLGYSLPAQENVMFSLACSAFLALVYIILYFNCYRHLLPNQLRKLLVFSAVCCLSYAWSGQWAIEQAHLKSMWAYSSEWLVELQETPSIQGRRGSVRVQLICRVSSLELAGCKEAVSMPLGMPVYAQLSYTLRDFKGNKKAFKPGQQWHVSLQTKSSLFSGNPGFDRSKWMLVERIIGTAKLTNARYFKLNKGVNYWRYWLLQRLEYNSHIEKSSYSELNLFPIISSLTLGERSSLTKQHWQLFRETGTTHLIAISGLHLGILAGFVYWVVAWFVSKVRWLNERLYPQLLASVLATLAAGGYSAMAGFSFPTQRAFIMLAFACIAVVFHRPKMMGSALAAALTLILFLQPFAILSASLWLSFTAVALVFMVIANRLPGYKSRKLQLMLGLKVQACLYVCMVPLSIYYFGGASLNSFVANLVAIPLVTLVLLPLCFINALVAIFNESSVFILGEINFWLIDGLLCFLQRVNELVGGYYVSKMGDLQFLLCVFAGLFLCFPFSRSLRLLGGLIFFLGCFLPVEPKLEAQLYNHSRMFFSISDGSEYIIYDETPGFHFKEKAILQNKHLVADTGMFNHWQESWLSQQSVIRRFIGQENSSFIKICTVSHTDLKGVGVSKVVTYEFGDRCFLSLQWRGQGHMQRWLILGQLDTDTQRALAENWPFPRQGKADVVFLSGNQFVGAFLNQVENSQLVIWSRSPLSEHMRARIEARSIAFYELYNTGALSVTLDSRAFAPEQVIPRRFYHLSF